MNRDLLDKLYLKMTEYFSGDPKRIHHFIKVNSLASLIGRQEGLSERDLFVLETAAYIHDCGIKPAEEKFGSCSGKLQEQEGSVVSEAILSELGFDKDIIDRVCYLVGRHHTYKNIDGKDCQILIEADFLVNLYEDGVSKDAILTAKERIFKTKSGTEILNKMYGIVR